MAWGLHRVQASGFWVQGFRVQGFGFRIVFLFLGQFCLFGIEGSHALPTSRAFWGVQGARDLEPQGFKRAFGFHGVP